MFAGILGFGLATGRTFLKMVFGDVMRLTCLLYTSDAADERSSVDLGGRRIIKKKNSVNIDGRSILKDKNTHW